MERDVIRSYTELKMLDTFDSRYKYLRLGGDVGAKTFGYDRFYNQRFYRSREWKNVRQIVIARDNGLDLGVVEHFITGRVLIHHMNPLTPESLDAGLSEIMDPEYLISTSHMTHNAIHYGAETPEQAAYTPRFPGDTKLW